MGAEKLRRMVYPAIVPRGGIVGIERVINAVISFIRLPHDQQAYFFHGVIDKGMANAGSGRKSNAVARFQFP